DPRASELPPGAPRARGPAARPDAPARDVRQRAEDGARGENRRPARGSARTDARPEDPSFGQSGTTARAAAPRGAKARAAGGLAHLAPVRLRQRERASPARRGLLRDARQERRREDA